VTARDPDPLNVRPNDPLVRWQRDAVKREQERAAAQAQLQRKEQTAIETLRAEMHEELARVRGEAEHTRKILSARRAPQGCFKKDGVAFSPRREMDARGRPTHELHIRVRTRRSE
jgi:hypothetical protein